MPFNLLDVGGPVSEFPEEAPPLDTDAPNDLPSTTARKDAAELSAGALVEPMSQAHRTALVWLGVAAVAVLVVLWPSASGGE